MPIALIDADSIIYKSGFTFEEKTVWNELEVSLGLEENKETTISSDVLLAKNAIDAIIENIKFKTGCDEVELWVTGIGNFRYEVMGDYKGNRTDASKPLDYNSLYSYLINTHKANKADGVEADDIVVYLKKTYPDDYVLCAIDKDVLYQSVGTHYNYGKDEFVTVSPEQAVRFFWFQVLTGDGADGYKGCKGVGKVSANRLLDEAEGMEGELDSNYRSVILNAYEKANQTYEEFLASCRVASMHQVSLEEGVINICLFE